MTGPNPAMSPVEAVICLATQGNLTEQMAQQPLPSELQSLGDNIASGPDTPTFAIAGKTSATWRARFVAAQ